MVYVSMWYCVPTDVTDCLLGDFVNCSLGEATNLKCIQNVDVMVSGFYEHRVS